jgi:hypothetical protein
VNQGASSAHPSLYPTNWGLVEINVCPQAKSEICDGKDNNGNGLVDEGYPDTDGDGTADCVDKEECDCLDNNGDGLVRAAALSRAGGPGPGSSPTLAWIAGKIPVVRRPRSVPSIPSVLTFGPC